MPKIIIDDREIEVAPGTKVIEAAEKLGIMIPRFCYHPALGSVGACRVCAVKFLQGPFKGVQMSCMVEARDGMVISTTDKEAVNFRKYVIEWLMLHHPHDCPVCDEGGHCLLQDMTVSGGHGIRRYLGKKRTYADQYLGPLLQHEMNRCIHCYRCARFYQEFSGYRDLGTMQSANRTYFGRFKDGVLESPFSGNLSDICPTGVYTDKPSRYFGRRWDYERSPSICINCSLGCHTVVSCRYRKVVRQEARFSKSVNGYFICDRGRYGFFYADLEERPRRAKLEGKEVPFDQAVETLSSKIEEISHRVGAEAIACVGAPRNSLETQSMIMHISRIKGWANPSYFTDRAITRKVKSAIARLEPDLVVSQQQVETADFILVIGADPVNEAPMLALAMRQAARNQAAVAVIDPRPVSLPFEFVHLPVALDGLNLYASALVKTAVGRDALKELEQNAVEFYDAIPDIAAECYSFKAQVSSLTEKLQNSQRPLIICGTEIVRENTPELAADCALLLKAAKEKAGLFYLMPGANAFCAGLFSEMGSCMEKTVEDIENGAVKALILIESNPFWQFPDRHRLEQALDQLELIVVFDYVGSLAAQKAHIFLPTATLFEVGGVFINQEGRVQAASRLFAGGMPIAQTGEGDHPPRVYGTGIPGCEARAAWQILAVIADVGPHLEEDLRSKMWNWLIETIPGFAGLPSIGELSDDGIRIQPGEKPAVRFSLQGVAKGEHHADKFEIICVERTFGTEELSAHSGCLKDLAETPVVFMNRSDAQKLDLTDGDRISIELGSGAITATLRAKGNMAAGTLAVPRHNDLDWQLMGTGRTLVGKDKIRKVE
ncbi:MAG: NADH-quinone oxidoreductase subunit NuoG [Deltaproteobacteria bacterium]